MKRPGDLIDAVDYAFAFRLLEPLPASPRRLLVLLHGVGGHEQQLASLGAAADADTLVVLPRAPRSVGEGMFGWFRVGFTEAGPQINPEEAEAARLALIEFIGQLQSRYAVDPAHTIVAGFSQGGIMSAGAVLTAPGFAAGFAVLSGRILPEIEPHLGAPDRLHALHALIIHGRQDDKLPVAWAERADAWLRRLGVPHDLRLHDARHELTPRMQADFLAWFADADRRWNRT